MSELPLTTTTQPPPPPSIQTQVLESPSPQKNSPEILKATISSTSSSPAQPHMTLSKPPPPPSSRGSKLLGTPPNSTTITKVKLTSPSLLRGKTDSVVRNSSATSPTKPSLIRKSSGNSVTFTGLLNDGSTSMVGSYHTHSLSSDDFPNPIPTRNINNNNNKTTKTTSSFPSYQLSSSSSPLSLDVVIHSQFEEEATTHILAALEAEEAEKESLSRLVGEGIDGMEDYSDDEEDDIRKDKDSSSSTTTTSTAPRDRTLSTDAFLKNLQLHDHLQQYQTTPPWSASHHRTHSHRPGSLSQREISAGSTIEGSITEQNEEKLAMYLNDVHGENDDTFVEAVINHQRNMSTADPTVDQKFSEDLAVHKRQLSGISEGNEGDQVEEATQERMRKDNPMVATSATNNISDMTKRLKQLQRGRNSKFLSSGFRSSISSSSKSSSVAADDQGVKPVSDGDKLLEALNSVAITENKSLWRKIRFEYTNLILPKLSLFRQSISQMLFFVIFPGLFVASLLFYILDNPMAGGTGTSISWFILFGVRQALIFEFARVGEVFWVEIAALRSKLFNKVFGPYVALAVIQSKGWPYVCIFWPVLDFCFLFGYGPFPRHWLYWQNYLNIFNEKNPVVGITDSDLYLRILLSSIFVGVFVSLKRLTLAIYLGRRTVSHFGVELEKLMAKMILIGEVANLAKDLTSRKVSAGSLPFLNLGDDDKLARFRNFVMEEDSSLESPATPSCRKALDDSKAIDKPGATSITSPSMGDLPSDSFYRPAEGESTNNSTPNASVKKDKRAINSSASNVKLLHLLEEWEEPEVIAHKNAKATVKDLLTFRQAVTFIDDQYPFSRAFGPAKSRELCVESAQKVYDQLVSNVDDFSSLSFSVFSVLATDEKGQMIDAKIKSLIRLLRPDRDGKLSKLDFVKSIDTVYKQLRLLRASIANSAQIDIAFEKIVNTFFYFFLVIIAVTILGIRIWSVFISINTLFLGASFLFGAAASNYFEGLLLIFVRRPYDIGDKIATSNPRTDTSPTGSSTWFVDRVTLFTTTVRFASTNEVATYSNGSLAQLRIINANRSPKAMVSLVMKFGLETPLKRISIFRSAVENFVKARPREWISLVGFRATRVEADAGYVEYKIVGQHRECWQNIGPIIQSKADLSSFCLEVSKRLDMRYESPPMPVNLSSSSDIMRDLLGKTNDVIGGMNVISRGSNNLKSDYIAKRSFSAKDLEDVVKMFEIRKK